MQIVQQLLRTYIYLLNVIRGIFLIYASESPFSVLEDSNLECKRLMMS
jgi:hypothetical protein